MAYLKVWLHLVWATKQRASLLTKEIRPKVFAHIKQNALSKGIHADFVNGHVDHMHALVSLGADQSISKIVQLMKGESSYWINNQQLIKTKFEWQDDYFAVSVSESNVNKVREYIKNQEQHHQNKTFQQEFDEFMKNYGFVLMKG